MPFKLPITACESKRKNSKIINWPFIYSLNHLLSTQVPGTKDTRNPNLPVEYLGGNEF